MIKAIISDVSYVLLFPKNRGYKGSLNGFYEQKRKEDGFSFSDYFELNIELLDYYRSIKDKIDLVIYTSDFIQDDIAIEKLLEKVFNKIYSAKKMNTHKSKIEGYQKIVSELGISAQEILFIDDNKENIEAGSKAGLKTFQYKNNIELFKELKKLL